MRPTRAVAYAESALAALGERRDRLRHAVLEARLGRYRIAAGDAAGATAALRRRAADVAPPEPSVERARILALLAQERMIAGAFRDAERAGRRGARGRARPWATDAEPEAIHAMTTLAVVRGWGDDPEAAPAAAPRGGRAGARRSASSRSGGAPVANMAVVLELLGRPGGGGRRSVRGHGRGPRAGPRRGLRRTCSAGTWPGSSWTSGRWEEARELSLRALDWSPAGVPFVNAILNLVIVEIESEAGEEAGRLLGRILVELETGGDFQFAIPAYQATASYAMWSGDLADARRAAERGWARLRGTEDWVLVARMAATALEVEAAIVAEALERRRIGDVAASRERAGADPRRGGGGGRPGPVARTAPGRGEPEASLATARAFHARLQGRDDPAALGRPRGALARHRRPVPRGARPVAPGRGDPRRRHRRARRRADRTDARVVRADAREPLLAAVELAMRPQGAAAAARASASSPAGP